MTIDDPIARFLDEEQSRNAGVRNPTTGIREEHDTAQRQRLRADEGKRKNEVIKRIILNLMQGELGREWLFDLLTTCNVFGTPFTADPVATAYNSGALYIGRMIENDIKKFAIKEYGAMLEEGWDRSKMWDDVAADGK